MTWSLSPEGIGKVLTDADASREAMGQDLAGLDGIAGALDGSCGPLSPIASALAGLLEDQSGRVNKIANRVNAGILATAESANAYLLGDEQIAANLIAAAEGAAKTGNFDAFAGGA